MSKRILYILLLVLPAYVGWVHAATPSATAKKEAASKKEAVAKKEELKNLRDRIDTMQKQLATKEENKSEAVDALRGSERAISETNRTLRDLGEQQRATQARLDDLDSQRRQTSSDIDNQQQRLARLFYGQYTGSEPNAIKLIFNGEDPNQVARKLYYLTFLAHSRADMVAELRANLSRLTDLARETQDQSAQLTALNAEHQKQRQQLEAEKLDRKNVLAKVSLEVEQQRRQISTLKENESRLAKLVDQLTQMLARSRAESLRNERVPTPGGDGSAFAQLKGRLSLPVRGELRNRFGAPRQDSGLSWKGLFIAATNGQDVKAIAAGKVVFADWLRGFGNLLIIDHGGGYMSLYGNNESIFKQVGEGIKGGETVASVGNSGGNPDSGLYFEIRYQGKAFDPLIWVRLK